MSDYYERLGNLLNETLESGKIPQKEAETEEKIPNEEQNNTRKEENTAFTSQKSSFKFKLFSSKKENAAPVGEVIKMHKYTQIMHISPEISKALSTLDIAYPCKWKDVSKKYHTLIKQVHPDNKNYSKNDENNEVGRQISELKWAYNTLKNWFNQ